MAEFEERPSKIRRLDSAVEDGSHEVISSAVVEASSLIHSSPTEDMESGLASPALNSEHEAHKSENAQPLSKNQLKKIRRRQQWEEGREYRKARRKEKEKEKKARKAEETVAVNEKSTENAIPLSSPPKKSHQRPIQVPITLVLDCDFDELMTDKEIISLASQVTRCYSENKNAQYRAHMVLSSFGGQLKQRFETVLASHHLGWKGVKFTDDDFVAAAREADIIMRSSQGGHLSGALAGSGDAVSASSQSSTKETAKSPINGTTDYDYARILEGRSVDYPPEERTKHSAMSTEAIYSSEKKVTPEVSTNINGPSTNGIATGTEEAITPSKSTPVPTYPDGLLWESASVDYAACVATQHPRSSKKPSIIYLTPDSPHTLDVLSPYTTYIIGGLVDKNRYKGICYKRAQERNIPTAKLPIGEYMTMQSRTVLATNHVVEVMVKWLEGGDWAKAFLKVIPKRKEAKLKVMGKTTFGQESQGDDVASNGLQVNEDLDEEQNRNDEENRWQN